MAEEKKKTHKGLKKSSFSKASLTERQIGATMGGKRGGVGAERFSIRKTQHEKVDGPPSGKKRAKRGETTHERKPTSVHPHQRQAFRNQDIYLSLMHQ